MFAVADHPLQRLTALTGHPSRHLLRHCFCLDPEDFELFCFNKLLDMNFKGLDKEGGEMRFLRGLSRDHHFPRMRMLSTVYSGIAHLTKSFLRMLKARVDVDGQVILRMSASC
jgi:hypothetical protein